MHPLIQHTLFFFIALYRYTSLFICWLSPSTKWKFHEGKDLSTLFIAEIPLLGQWLAHGLKSMRKTERHTYSIHVLSFRVPSG